MSDLSNIRIFLPITFCLIALLYLPLFGHLDSLCIRIYDEARNAINAFEMLKHGNLFILYFYGEEDLWNTKPPLLIIIQAIFLKIFGINEVAIRLPVAIFAFSICTSIFLFSIRVLRSQTLAIVSVLALVTTNGFISIHGSRTGDFDVVLTYFMILSILTIFKWLNKDEISSLRFKSSKYLLFFFLFTSLAVLTKSIQAILFAPAILIYIIWKKSFLVLLKTKAFYYGLSLFFIFVGGFHLVRELLSSGYLSAILDNNVTGRYLQVKEGNDNLIAFYFNNIKHYRINWTVYLYPLSILTCLLHPNKLYREFSIFNSLLIFSYLLFISISATKLEWYDIPILPLISFQIAIFLTIIIESLVAHNFLIKQVVPLFLLITIYFQPYTSIINKTYLPDDRDRALYNVPYYLKRSILNNKSLDNNVILAMGYVPHIQFYTYQLQEKNQNVIIKHPDIIVEGDTIITQNDVLLDKVKTRFNLVHIDGDEFATRYFVGTKDKKMK